MEISQAQEHKGSVVERQGLAACPLWEEAAALSGVSAEEALEVDKVCLYDRLGEAVLRRLSTAFYERVYCDTVPLPSGPLLRAAFANTTKADAAANQALFLVERLGGPKLFSERKGRLALISRHAPYAGVTREAAERWLQHMHAALDSVPEVDEDSKHRLSRFFKYNAFLITEGRQLVNPQRIIGYSKHI